MLPAVYLRKLDRVSDMKPLIRWMLGTISVLLLCLIGADLYLERTARIAAAGPGGRDFPQITAGDLERKVRDEVPIGSTRPFVEDFLTKEGMRFSSDPSKRSVHANAPYVKGSGWIVYESLGFTFYFDDASRLKSIEAKIHLTGP